MNKSMIFIIIMGAIGISGCSGMHDGQGWEHGGDKSSHQMQESNSVFEHQH